MTLNPGATVGILGAGQLGRMLAMAAAKLGLRSHVYAPDSDAPAYGACSMQTVAAFDDWEALVRFADEVDVITYEFENVPAECVAFLAARKPVRPDARALATAQDRLSEKSFLASIGLETAPFRAVDDLAGLAPALRAIGRPAILKTRRFGYAGKGQIMIREGTDLAEAHRSLGEGPMILEGFVTFEREVSVIVARSVEGDCAVFDLCENEHERHILARTHVPAVVAAATAAAADKLARRVADALNYVGVLGVEMFLVTNAEGVECLVVNELAPRVHNSGHWTLDGAVTSQFEQHVRAVAGWPLGATTRRGRVEMRNLIGDEADRWRDILAEPEWSLHLYGKLQSRPGRKMGHMTRVFREEAAG